MDEHAINLTSEQGALAEDQQHPDAAPAADDTERASESDFDAAPTTPYALRLSDDLAASDIPDNFQEQLAEFGSAAAKAGVREDVAQRMLDVYVDAAINDAPGLRQAADGKVGDRLRRAVPPRSVGA